MKRKNIIIILGITAVCGALIGLTACKPAEGGNGGNPTSHVHSFIASVTPPTCTEHGYTTHTCECGESYTDSYVSATDHLPQTAVKENEVKVGCTSDGSYDEVVRCFVCNEILSSTHNTIEMTGHNFEGGICLNCGNLQTDELEFTKLSDGTYSVSKGSAADENIVIPSVYQGIEVTAIAENAFNDSSIKSVTIPDSITEIGTAAFYNCNSLTGIYYQGDIAGWCAISGTGELMSYGDNATLYINGTELTGELIIPDGVTSIGNYAFCNCIGVTSVTIPDGVTSIGSYSFYGCSGLTSITIPDGVTDIGGYAFYDCYNLAGVTIPNGVTSIGDLAFYHCDSLTSITIPDGVTSIGNSTFRNCSGLTSVIIPDSVTGIGNNAFANSGLTSVIIPDGLTSIGDSAFSRCSGLTSISIPDSVTSIGDYVFERCSGLTSVTISDSVTSIGNSTFRNCSGLTSVTIPDGVTSIGIYAFYHCDSLTNITIPDSVTSIGDQAFAFCDSLTSVYYKGTAEDWESISISSENIDLTEATRYYYSETEPSTDGNYWHYLDGEIVVWAKTED